MIDLHMHSWYSEDGEFTPAELVEQCSRQGITAMSITDHNCARANAEARAQAEANGIRYISGIEIDCVYKGLDFHVLGYGIDEHSEDFARIEENIERQGFRASLERLEKTQVLGFHITQDEMWELSRDAYWKGSWSGEMFAELLLAKPEYADHPLLRPYRPGGARNDNPYVNFYWDYYAQGKPCYVKMEYPPMDEIIGIIHRNRGKAVLAHPGVNLKSRKELLKEILDLGMDGVEAFSSYHTPEQASEFYRETQKRGLFATCGSDYHGKTKPAIRLGGYGELPPDFALRQFDPCVDK